MPVLTNTIIVLLTVAGMELFSWFVHKYLFHGPLWFIHRSHHQERTGWFEWNDIFSCIFAAVSMGLMWLGREGLQPVFWTGFGISLYGLIYFIFHDWFIHNRFSSFKTKNRYLLAIRRAHKLHHKSIRRVPSQEFGLLTASRKHFKKADLT